MADVTHIHSQIESSDPSAGEHLLPLVYQELRKLAATKLSREQRWQQTPGRISRLRSLE